MDLLPSNFDPDSLFNLCVLTNSPLKQKLDYSKKGLCIVEMKAWIKLVQLYKINFSLQNEGGTNLDSLHKGLWINTHT